MGTQRFAVLQAEFETLSKRLKETSELADRQAILKEVSRLLHEMHLVLEVNQADLQKKLNRLRNTF